MVPISSWLKTAVTVLGLGIVVAAVLYYNRAPVAHATAAAATPGGHFKLTEPIIAAVTHPAQYITARPSPKASPTPCAECQARLARYRDSVLNPRVVFPNNVMELSRAR